MIKDYYDLLEKFSIMTDGGHLDDESVYKYLETQTTPELLEQLKKNTSATQDGPARLSNNDVLNNYVINSIGLYPCSNTDGNIHSIVKIYDDKHEPIKENIIKDVEHLQEWKNKNVSIFALYPQHNNLIVLDLDNSDQHANTTNGIKNFIDLITGVELTDQYKKYFENFPVNFPCYVETPHNGIHLYFKASYIPTNWTPNVKDLDKLNIEIKYNKQVTAGGSLRDGKEYKLRGNLENIPRLPPAIINLLTKGRPQPIKPPAGSYIKQDGKSWNATLDGCINKAIEKHGTENPNEFIKNASVICIKAGFEYEETLRAIQQTPQHQARRNPNETETTVKWCFNNIRR